MSESPSFSTPHGLVVRGGKVEVVPASVMTERECELYVTDLERLAGRLVGEYIKKTGFDLSEADEEDMAAFLLAQAWEEAQRWNGVGSLRGFLVTRLRFRCTDWYRKRFGDERHLRKGLQRDGLTPQQIEDRVEQRRQTQSLDADDRYRFIPNTDDEIARIISDMDDSPIDMTVEDAAEALGFDLQKLSKEARQVFVKVAVPLGNGESELTIQDDIGWSKKRIAEGLDMLYTEIKALA